nr:MAG TPA: terminase small subunit [Caudoviricetes sp.]
MGRNRNPNRDKAFSIYKENNGNIAIDEISNILNEDIKRIKIWKSTDKWDISIGLKSNKRGAPKKNKNAKGNKGGPGAKKENQYARKMGWYSKYQPRRVCKIVDEIEASNVSQLDIMWAEIKMQWALIIDNSKQLHVDNKEDHTKVVKKKSSTEFGDTTEYEVITAYEKQLKYTKEMSNARKVLFELIEKYIVAVNKDWNLVSEEHKLRVEMLRSKINNNDDSKEDKIDKYLTAINKEINNDN